MPLAGDRLSTRELAWMVDEEHVTRLTDIVKRRTDLAFTGDVTHELLEQIADALTPLLGWDDARRRHEVDETVAELRDRNGIDLATRATA